MLLRYFRLYIFGRKVWLRYWKFQFFLSTEDKHFLTKPEFKNLQGGGVQVPHIALLTFCPLPGAGRGEALCWVRTCRKQQPARSQKCCKIRGGGKMQCRSLQRRGRGLQQRGHNLQCSTSEEKQEVSLSKRERRKRTIFSWLLVEGLLHRCCRHKCSVRGTEGAPAGKELA